MAWSAPMTAVAKTVFTAVQYNRYIRDNLLETGPAKATAAGNHFGAPALNQLEERTIKNATISTSQTTTSTSYTDLATTGPTVTCPTGREALIFLCVTLSNSLVDALASMSFEISGNTTESAVDDWRVSNDGCSAGISSRLSVCRRLVYLKPGTHTFTAKYRVGSGTGTFANRELIAFPL